MLLNVDLLQQVTISFCVYVKNIYSLMEYSTWQYLWSALQLQLQFAAQSQLAPDQKRKKKQYYL